MPVLTSMPSARAAGATTVAPRHRQRAVASASRPPLASTSSRRPQTTVYANGRQSATGLILPQLEAVTDSVSAFSPATVANLGAGFDFMGCAVEVRSAPWLHRYTPHPAPHASALGHQPERAEAKVDQFR